MSALPRKDHLIADANATNINRSWGKLFITSRSPAPALRGLVSAYRGFRLRTARTTPRLETPMALAALHIGLGGPCRAAGGDDRYPDTMIYGVRNNAVRVVPPAEYHGVQALLTPRGACWLLGPRMSEFANELHDATDVLGRPVALLSEQVMYATSWDERFDLFDRLFLGLLGKGGGTPPYEAAHWAWQRLVDGGVTRVDALAAELGWSQRRLQLAFQRYVGFPPKVVMRMVRFRRAVRALACGADRVAAADLAAHCGYYDQAHLIRDFKAVTGTTPRSFRSAHPTLYPAIRGIGRHASAFLDVCRT